MIRAFSWLTCFLLVFSFWTDAFASGPAETFLIADDVLVPEGGTARIEAFLRVEKFSLWKRPAGGEVIRFRSIPPGGDGRALTGGDGRARWVVAALPVGIHRYEAISDPSPRVKSAASRVTVAVWPADSPLLFVDLNVILPDEEDRLPGRLSNRIDDWVPPRGAVQVLRVLSRRYRIVYMTDRSPDAMEGIRNTMKRYEFPTSPILRLEVGAGPRSLEKSIHRWISAVRDAGWTNLVAGVGATLDDAMAFGGGGLRVVVLSDRVEKEDLPAGARKVASWEAVARELR